MTDPPSDGGTSSVNLFDCLTPALVTRSRWKKRNGGQVIGKALKKASIGHHGCVRRRLFLPSGGDIVKRFEHKVIVVFLFVLALNSFYSCAPHKELIDSEAEMWEFQMTGLTEGKLEMMLKEVEIEKDISSVAGKFFGRIRDHYGGMGRLKCKLEGKIEKNSFLADFTGYADVEKGRVFITGSMRGTVWNSEGSGTWSLKHMYGFSRGEWTIKRMKTSQ